ncbi:MAG: DUF2029 domain-containing protein [Candidatus Solibacter usitatus]|nr:DUF2029 domain-containing protein [Candidatus Solibacter usitatus]
MTTRRVLVLSLLLAAGWLGLYFQLTRSRVLRGNTDYLSFYSGGRLSGAGQLYDIESYFRIHDEVMGERLSGAHGFTRLPYYALLHKPLSLLPYKTAYWLWLALTSACMAWLIAQFAPHSREFLILAVCFPATYLAVLNGQDTALLAALVAGAVLAMRQGRNALAGALWALCSIKYHLFVLLPFALIAGRKWRVLGWAATAGAALAAVSFAVEGWAWPLRYLDLLRQPGVQVEIDAMPNARLLLASAGLDVAWARAVTTLAVAALALWAMFKHRDAERGLIAALLGGLLVVPHDFLHDTVLLLPCLAMARERATRLVLAAAVFPLAALLLQTGRPQSALMPALILAALVSVAISKPAAAAPASP